MKVGNIMNNVAEIILDQLGGNRFIAMTGASHFVSTPNSLRMHLPKNGSKANRLEITLMPNDTYTLRFYKYSAPRLNHTKMTWSEEKVEEIKCIENVYSASLQSAFTSVTKMYTSL